MKYYETRIPIPYQLFYADGSLFLGLGSAFNISGRYFDYNDGASPEKADADALMADWHMVGQDMYDSMDKAADYHRNG